MGLFDFFKRKPAPRPELAEPEESEGPSPHYVFAHFALRSISLADPLHFLAFAVSPKSAEFVEAVLQDVREHCEGDFSFDASKVKFHPTNVNASPCVVVELPEPQNMAEAFMVALVVDVDLSSEEPSEDDEVSARFITLEKGYSFSGEPRTVLAEWDSRGHANYGDGPEPTVDAFVAAIRNLIG